MGFSYSGPRPHLNWQGGSETQVVKTARAASLSTVPSMCVSTHGRDSAGGGEGHGRRRSGPPHTCPGVWRARLRAEEKTAPRGPSHALASLANAPRSPGGSRPGAVRRRALKLAGRGGDVEQGEKGRS